MIQIRPLIFETNSSSVHCLVVLTASEYNAWKNGEAFIDYYAFRAGEDRRPKVCTLEELKEKMKAEEDFHPEDYSDEKDAIEEYGRDYEDVFSYEYVDCEYEILTVKVDDKVVVSIEGYDG